MKRTTLIVLIWGQSFLLAAPEPTKPGITTERARLELKTALRNIQDAPQNPNSRPQAYEQAARAARALADQLQMQFEVLNAEIEKLKKDEPGSPLLADKIAKLNKLTDEKDILDARVSALENGEPDEKESALQALLDEDSKNKNNNNNPPANPPPGNNDPAPQDQPQQAAAPAGGAPGGQQGQQPQTPQTQNQQKAADNSSASTPNALLTGALGYKGVNVPATSVQSMSSSIYGFTKNIGRHALNGVKAFGGAILSTGSGLPSSGPGLQVAKTEKTEDNRTALLTSAVKPPYGKSGTLTLAVGLKAQAKPDKVVKNVPKKPITAWVGLKAANEPAWGYRDSSTALMESAGMEAKPGSGHRR